jgi:hypothetical protein
MEFKDITIQMPPNETAVEVIKLLTQMAKTMKVGFRTMEMIVSRIDSGSFSQYGICVSDVREVIAPKEDPVCEEPPSTCDGPDFSE